MRYVTSLRVKWAGRGGSRARYSSVHCRLRLTLSTVQNRTSFSWVTLFCRPVHITCDWLGCGATNRKNGLTAAKLIVGKDDQHWPQLNAFYTCERVSRGSLLIIRRTCMVYCTNELINVHPHHGLMMPLDCGLTTENQRDRSLRPNEPDLWSQTRPKRNQ